MRSTGGPMLTRERIVRALVCALIAFALSCAAPAGRARAAGTCGAPPVSQYLAANASEVGVIHLLFFDAEGSPVVFSECVRNRLHAIGTVTAPPDTMTQLTTTWSCTRAVRNFVATTTLPNGNVAIGAYSVRTPSCAQRFEITAPRRVTPGASGRIRVADRWGIGGIRPQLCITAPRAKRSCRPLTFAKAVAIASRNFHAPTRGRWRIELRVRGFSTRTTVTVGGDHAVAEPRLPKLLAAGDSTMQGIDNFLADDLASVATVRSDVRPGTGITRLNPWAGYAAHDVRSLHPGVTVVSIGGNDAYPMTTLEGTTVTCCDDAWVAEYATRVRALMQTFLRKGRGRVYWLTLVVPRDPRRVPIFAAVNRSILLAADGLARVQVLRMDELFSPNGYQQTIRYRGRDVDVREPDGIHLNVSGTAIAAKAIEQALKQR